jgi:protein gp37
MGKDSGIEWTHHTFNPWWGCVKVSPACKHCYAETWSKRVGARVWGKKASRRFFGLKHWQQPLLWDREAKRAGERRRVFCASMADVFEDRNDLDNSRHQLWEIIARTSSLDWLLLTKRPENVASMVPWTEEWPGNVWLGTTVEDQKWADKRIPVLLALPAAVRFLSCEPMLGPIDLSRWLLNGGDCHKDGLDSKPKRRVGSPKLHWVIAGGESGHHARPMHPAWVRNLRDQCINSNVAFHFKQWGNWKPSVLREVESSRILVQGGIAFEFMHKSKAGRELDGQFWDQFPASLAR